MRTPNLGKEVLLSLPINVEFAGFRSDTLTLAKNGWDLSVEQGWSQYNSGYEMRLAMRHEGARLYAITTSLRIEREFIYELVEQRPDGRNVMVEWLRHTEFRVQVVSPNIQFHVMPPKQMSIGALMDFQPIDPEPQFQRVDIKDFKFFKVANPTIKDILVTPDQVPELLDVILKAQKPMMDKIKKNAKSRENLAQYRAGDYEIKPGRQVQAQIITLAG